MTALLTDNLPLLAGAPNGIKKLRELILELAVCGKLVPQSADDEPASELLKRISEEKAGQLAGGKIKNKTLLGIAGEERLFQLPSAWEWCKLSALLPDFQNGVSSRGDANGVIATVLRLADIKLGEISLEDTRSLTLDAKTFRKHRLEAGDVLLIRVNGSAELVGRFIVCRKELQAIPCDHFIRMRLPKDVIDSGYLKIVGDSEPVRRVIAGLFVSTAGQKTVNQGHIGSLPIPLPPLDQQRRIVTKVDELMALCDRLEARQFDATTAHAQLVQALLDSLTQASNATDFAANWQRLAECFHTLFITEPSIDALKQTLLQLAVTGKLVPQDVSGCHQDGLPAGWEEIRIEEFCTVQGGIQKTPLRRPISQHFPYLRVANVQRGRIDIKELERYELSLAELAKWRLNAGDLLIVEGNGSENEIGRCAIWRGEVGDCVYQNHLMRVRPEICEQVEYLALYLNSPVGIAHMKRLAITTSGLFNLSVGKIRSIPVALPPVSEQRRIVAKVDQLMELCDQLKTYLTQGRLLNEQLANTLIQHALAEDAQKVLHTIDRQTAHTLLAAEITHRLHNQRTFGQRKLQKVIYLAEHAAKLAEIRGDYLRDAAGPHDRQLMNKVEGEMQKHQWYERIERETVGHAYRPLSQAGQHRQGYRSAWSAAEQATIEQVIELMRDWDTDRCEMTVTLYAAWNDFILEGRPVTDEAIVDEVMHSWNDTKLRFGKTEWLAVLAEMKKHKILMPTGFGKRTKGGMLSLPGFE